MNRFYIYTFDNILMSLRNYVHTIDNELLIHLNILLYIDIY